MEGWTENEDDCLLALQASAPTSFRVTITNRTTAERSKSQREDTRCENSRGGGAGGPKEVVQRPKTASLLDVGRPTRTSRPLRPEKAKAAAGHPADKATTLVQLRKVAIDWDVEDSAATTIRPSTAAPPLANTNATPSTEQPRTIKVLPQSKIHITSIGPQFSQEWVPVPASPLGPDWVVLPSSTKPQRTSMDSTAAASAAVSRRARSQHGTKSKKARHKSRRKRRHVYEQEQLDTSEENSDSEDLDRDCLLGTDFVMEFDQALQVAISVEKPFLAPSRVREPTICSSPDKGSRIFANARKGSVLEAHAPETHGPEARQAETSNAYFESARPRSAYLSAWIEQRDAKLDFDAQGLLVAQRRAKAAGLRSAVAKSRKSKLEPELIGLIKSREHQRHLQLTPTTLVAGAKRGADLSPRLARTARSGDTTNPVSADTASSSSTRHGQSRPGLPPKRKSTLREAPLPGEGPVPRPQTAADRAHKVMRAKREQHSSPCEPETTLLDGVTTVRKLGRLAAPERRPPQ